MALLDADADARRSRSPRTVGFTWLTVAGDPTDMAGLCTDLHAVNTTLEAQGFGAGLLCSLVASPTTAGRRLGLVYLYKQGTFYPFAPTAGRRQARDNLARVQVRDPLADDSDRAGSGRWLAVWGAPGL